MPDIACRDSGNAAGLLACGPPNMKEGETPNDYEEERRRSVSKWKSGVGTGKVDQAVSELRQGWSGEHHQDGGDGSRSHRERFFSEPGEQILGRVPDQRVEAFQARN